MLKLYSEGKFPVDRLVKVYKAEEINEAIEDSEKGSTIKPVLVWE
jgi:aryl-alcohol dehydrogenase